jgi:predicted PurR-regulated permease PerM
MSVNPISQQYTWTFRRVVWATLVLVFVFFCFWALYRFYQVVFIAFIAIVIGTVIRPLVNWLYQRGVPRIAGVILVYLLLLILLAGFLWLLLPLIFEQSSTLAKEVPGYYQNLRAGMMNNSNQLIVGLGNLLPAA